jgi:hypothetical protein
VLTCDDADVQNLLAQFETAACDARRASSSGASAKTQSRSVSSSEFAERESLPTIPVYRKSKLEVYRRTPAGDLMKVKEI